MYWQSPGIRASRGRPVPFEPGTSPTDTAHGRHRQRKQSRSQHKLARHPGSERDVRKCRAGARRGAGLCEPVQRQPGAPAPRRFRRGPGPGHGRAADVQQPGPAERRQRGQLVGGHLQPALEPERHPQCRGQRDHPHRQRRRPVRLCLRCIERPVRGHRRRGRLRHPALGWRGRAVRVDRWRYRRAGALRGRQRCASGVALGCERQHHALPVRRGRITRQRDRRLGRNHPLRLCRPQPGADPRRGAGRQHQYAGALCL
ncbi:hypothetical protein ACAN107058_14690 [Paracidovorax anthurii]